MHTQTDPQFSTIAELVFLKDPALNFARLVGDLDGVLTRFARLHFQMTWDCEDVATFDMPGTRIVLAICDQPRPNIEASLTISVGPSHLPVWYDQSPHRPFPALRHAALCSKLVERIQTKARADAVFWHECPTPVGEELIDALHNALPDIASLQAARNTAPSHPIHRKIDEGSVSEIINRVYSPANDLPTICQPAQSAPKDPELARLRAALYPELELRIADSFHIRLAAHTMNATLVMVALPIGAAMMTYSLFRGGNLRMTSAALVASVFAPALLQSFELQHLVTMASL